MWNNKSNHKVYSVCKTAYNTIEYLEGSHSGRVRHLGKVVRGKPLREFESPTLRRSLKRSFKGRFEDLSYICECATTRKFERCTESVRFESPTLRSERSEQGGWGATIFVSKIGARFEAVARYFESEAPQNIDKKIRIGSENVWRCHCGSGCRCY